MKKGGPRTAVEGQCTKSWLMSSPNCQATCSSSSVGRQLLVHAPSMKEMLSLGKAVADSDLKRSTDREGTGAWQESGEFFCILHKIGKLNRIKTFNLMVPHKLPPRLLREQLATLCPPSNHLSPLDLLLGFCDNHFLFFFFLMVFTI